MELRKQDWILNIAVLFLAFCGLLSLYSGKPEFFRQQIIWYTVGAAVFLAVASIDWRPLINYPKLINGIYIFSVFLLTLTYFLAPRIRGARSWIVMGSFQFQASEFAKLALILVFSFFWSKAHVRIAHFKNLAVSFLYFVIPAGLILLQPDMGSALILFGIWFGYLLVSGIKWRHLAIATAVFAVGGIILWSNFLAGYQKERVLGLFYPERDPLGANYNVIQSKIAIGSAGLFGKGFRQGAQAQLGFLPESQTDFIFSAFTEEWGLIGGFLAIVAFLVIMSRIIKAGLGSENNFFRLVCLGAIIMFMLHFFINVGSALGILPVIGVSFPFLSYGGSNLLTSLILIGIIQSIIIRSKF